MSLSLYFGFRSDEFTPFAGIATAGGVANFIALFFSNPQTRLRRLIGDLVQMRMINASLVMEINTAYIQIKIDSYKLDTVIKVQKAISKITGAAIKNIEDRIGSDSNSAGTSTTRGNSKQNGGKEAEVGDGGNGKGARGTGSGDTSGGVGHPPSAEATTTAKDTSTSGTKPGKQRD